MVKSVYCAEGWADVVVVVLVLNRGRRCPLSSCLADSSCVFWVARDLLVICGSICGGGSI